MTREEAISVLQDKSHFDTSVYGYEAIDVAIEALQAEPVKHGEWKEHTVANAGVCLKDSIECSVCGYLFCKHDIQRKNFCPNCGAKMEGKK